MNLSPVDKRNRDQFHASNGRYIERHTEGMPERYRDNIKANYKQDYLKALRRNGAGAMGVEFFRTVFDLNGRIQNLWKEARGVDFGIASDEESVKELARLRADRCAKIAREYRADENATLHNQPAGGLDWAYMFLGAKCDDWGIEMPDVEKHGARGVVLRLIDAKWWRRQLRKEYSRSMEEFSRAAFGTHKKANPYVSIPTLQRRRVQIENNIVTHWCPNVEEVKLT